MKSIVILSLGLGAAAGLAQPPPAASPATPPRSDPNQIRCETIHEIGSRLVARRVCMTVAQWQEMRRQTRLDVDRAQVRVKPGSGM